MAITIGSLFSGIGGLDKGLERATGGDTVWQVEINPFARRVLAHHWPKAKQHEDVRAVGRHNLTSVDVVCGGSPCQNISAANTTSAVGIFGEKSGLFFELARVVREIGPTVVVVENSPALLYRGMGEVLGCLAGLGYDAVWDVLSAEQRGAPHLRERLFLVAALPTRSRIREVAAGPAPFAAATAAYANVPCGQGVRRPIGTGSTRTELDGGPLWRWWAPASAVRRMDDGLPSRLDRPRRGRRPANDRHRLHALGNAVVPAVAEVVGRVVAEVLGLSPSRTPTHPVTASADDEGE